MQEAFPFEGKASLLREMTDEVTQTGFDQRKIHRDHSFFPAPFRSLFSRQHDRLAAPRHRKLHIICFRASAEAHSFRCGSHRSQIKKPPSAYPYADAPKAASNR